MGRDACGACIETRKINELRVIVDKWRTKILFKRDDGTVIEQKNHIITATRTLKHVRERYERSLASAGIFSVESALGNPDYEDTAQKLEYTAEREFALRAERDRWLLYHLERFAEDPEAAYLNAVQDSKKTDVLRLIKKLLSAIDKAATSIRILEKAEPKTSKSREYKETRLPEARTELEEKTHELRKCMWANFSLFIDYVDEKLDYLPGEYGWILKHVKTGDLEKARGKADELLSPLAASSPRFIFDELSKNHDPYLQDMLAELGKGLKALEAQEFKTAQTYFVQAAQEMRSIVQR